MPPTIPPAVPKLIQRFRARELQRLVDAGALRQPFRNGTDICMRDVDVGNVRMNIPLHNPFLPRPLFNRPPPPAGTPEAPQQRKKWAPPEYSLRRQANIVKAARASGMLHLLPPGPKLSVEELQEAKREARRRARAAKASQKGAEAKRDARLQEKKANGQTAVESEAKQEAVEQVEADASLAPSSTSVHTGSKRRRWVIRSATTLAKRRSSARAGYPGVVFRWTGKVPIKGRAKKGGLTVYAGRRRMFKGHKWERQLQKRRGQIAVRMRDMRKRIRRFKNVYKKRRAKPLSPAVPRKKESLPF